MNRSSRYGDGGFTVVEFVIAAAVLFVVAMGVFGATTYVANSSRSSSVKVAALNLANEKLETIRNLPYDKVGLTGGAVAIPGVVPTEETINDYNVETDVFWARDEATGRALYKIVQVNVNWTQGVPGSISVASNVFGKSDLVNTGDLSVTVVDWATGDPISGVQVTATYTSGAVRGQTVGSDGEAFFGYLPTGEYTIDVQKAGYIWDEALLSATTVAPDLLTNIVIEMQEPSTLRIIVTDSDGSPIPGADVVVSRTDVPNLTGTTNSSGVASFSGLVVDEYDVHVGIAGRASADVVAHIDTPGTTVDVPVVLPKRVGLVVQAVGGGGAPLPGTTVRVLGPSPSSKDVNGSPRTTASNGEASFGILANGTYTIMVSRSGYSDRSIVVAYNGLNPPVVVTMSPIVAGSLVVHTMTDKGVNRPWERIKVTGPSGYSREVTTDWQGYYTFSDLASGQYTVSYNAKYKNNGSFDKYKSSVKKTVSAGSQTDADLKWKN